MKTLKDVPPGQSAVVAKVTVAGTVRLRLMAMGLLKGARVKIIKVAPLDDPIEIIIGIITFPCAKQRLKKSWLFDYLTIVYP